MNTSQKLPRYVDVDELAALTGLSRATIWRLKRAGRIPYRQPASKGGRVKFPANALEIAAQCEPSRQTHGGQTISDDERLPGPRPAWMSSTETE